MMQIESIHHIHEKWGPHVRQLRLWLRKVKAMLDPNSVADWSAYIPAEYPEEAGVGALVELLQRRRQFAVKAR